jgi:chromosomal replication initiator protein
LGHAGGVSSVESMEWENESGSPGDLWRSVLGSIREQVSPKQFDMWFKSTRASVVCEGQVEILVPSDHARDWLERRFTPLVQAAVSKVTRWVNPEIRFVHAQPSEKGGPEKANLTRVEAPAEKPAEKAIQHADAGLVINRNYTFDNFVVGPHNEIAVAAARSIVHHDVRHYNPLFIYGNVGLGKTHLLQAICHGLLSRPRPPKIVYVSCELFINQFISAIEKGQLDAFRGRYRQTEVLVIDDVHFIANKDRSQEEFFHTFNDLHQRDRQIILSSDSPPLEIPTLSERLVSRFKQGMVCQLESPLYETRLQMAKAKATQLGTALPDDVLDFIARTVQTNVRDLHGAVTRVIGVSSLKNIPVSLALARQTLGDILPEHRRRTTLDDIVSAVTDHFGMRRAELQSKRRTKALTEPRQMCMFLARKLTNLSLEEIGVFFGGRDHSTVLYGAERVSSRLLSDIEFKKVVEGLAHKLGGSITRDSNGAGG